MWPIILQFSFLSLCINVQNYLRNLMNIPASPLLPMWESLEYRRVYLQKCDFIDKLITAKINSSHSST